MTSNLPVTDALQGTTRRAFLARSALVLGSAALVPALQACGASSTSSNVALDLEGWNYDPALSSKQVQGFEANNSNIKVKFNATALAQYPAKLISRYRGGNPPDAIFVNEDYVAAWAAAGYIRSVDDLPGASQALAGLVPFDRAGLTYNGKLWGTPYFGDVMVYIYNEHVLQKAGIDQPADTWDELAKQAAAIKRAGVLDKPIVFALNATAGLHWWAAVYASGGNLFDSNSNPVFPDDDPVALQLLTWLVKAAKDGILDPNSVQMGTAEERQAFAAGQTAFTSSAHYDLRLLNNSSKSKVAGAAKQILFPSLTSSGPHATVGFTALYAVSAKSKHVDEAWKLIKWLGAPAQNRELFIQDGQAVAYTSLQSDPEVLRTIKQWSDPTISDKQTALAKTRQSVSEPWFQQWATFNQQQLQEALIGKKSPHQALSDSASEARRLKKGKA
jgi:multiple sugar transport system substrate-binding protein